MGRLPLEEDPMKILLVSLLFSFSLVYADHSFCENKKFSPKASPQLEKRVRALQKWMDENTNLEPGHPETINKLSKKLDELIKKYPIEGEK